VPSVLVLGNQNTVSLLLLVWRPCRFIYVSRDSKASTPTRTDKSVTWHSEKHSTRWKKNDATT